MCNLSLTDPLTEKALDSLVACGMMRFSLEINGSCWSILAPDRLFGETIIGSGGFVARQALLHVDPIAKQ